MQRGADPWQAAGYLGMSLEVLLNTYGHHHPDYLSDAVELVLKGHTPTRLVVFDHRPQVDDQREAVEAAKTRLADASSPVIVEALFDVLARGQRLRPRRRSSSTSRNR